MEITYQNHRGRKVEQVLNEKGIKISSLAKMIDLHEEQVGVLLGDQFLDYAIINFIGRHIEHNFSNEFPEIQSSSSKLGDKEY